MNTLINKIVLAPLFTLALASGFGGCMLSVEADVPDVEVTQHDIAFPGIPGAAQLGDLSTGKSFTQERPALDLPGGIDSSVKAVSIELTAKTGITNFDFLKALHITMIPKGGSEPIELINYEKAPQAVVGKVLSISAKNPVNILEQWKADSATFTVDVAGTLPEANWTIDMSVHFAGKASYKY
jgi:hypothetical protein